MQCVVLVLLGTSLRVKGLNLNSFSCFGSDGHFLTLALPVITSLLTNLALAPVVPMLPVVPVLFQVAFRLTLSFALTDQLV